LGKIPVGTLIQGTPFKWAKGSGSGFGDGFGSGFGDGFGSGSGSGYGYGDGSGSGYGDGYGYGDGDGDGYGDGYGSYWRSCIKYFAAKWTAAQRKRLAELQRSKAKIAYWRSDSQGRPANGGMADPVKPGDVQREKGPLNLCNRGTLHATLLPPKWQGERWWIVALHGKVIGDDEKYGALEREIIGEAL
jgi:hypothetical protein